MIDGLRYEKWVELNIEKRPGGDSLDPQNECE